MLPLEGKRGYKMMVIWENGGNGVTGLVPIPQFNINKFKIR